MDSKAFKAIYYCRLKGRGKNLHPENAKKIPASNPAQARSLYTEALGLPYASEYVIVATRPAKGIIYT